MKKLISIFIVFITVGCFAQQKIPLVLVTWDANVETDLAGYRLYYGTVSNNYSDTLKTGLHTGYLFRDKLNFDIRYYFAMTAYDSAGNESDFSDEISFIAYSVPQDTLPPVKPKNGKAERLFKEEK